MKKTLLLVSLSSLALAVGCSRSESTESADKQMDRAQAASKEASQQMKEYAFAQKSEFVTMMQMRLTDLNVKIEEISAKIEKSSEAVKADLKPKLAVLREQAVRLNAQLVNITQATPSTWDAIKADSEKAYNSLKDGVAQSRQWMSDKIAP